MALKYLCNLDINNNVLQNMRVFASGSAPTASIGALYVDTGDSNKLKYHDGSSWVALGSATGDLTAIVAGTGMTGTNLSGPIPTLNVIGGNGITANADDIEVSAAQTTITSILATDLKLGEDDQTKIDFETANQIHFYADNAEQVYVADGIFGPETDSDVDLGSSSVRWKDAYVDSITVTGEIDGASLDISGNADIDGTMEADAYTVAGTALSTYIAGITVTDATNAAHVLVTDNESTNENNLITFVEGATSSTGNVGLEMDGDFYYNPSTGRLTATQLAGTLQTAAQTNITSVGTLGGGAISSGFGNIDNGSSTFNTGAATVDSLSVSDGNITNVGDIALDSISADGTDINIAVSDNSATALTIKQGSDAYLIIDTGNSSESVSIGTGISGTAITIGHSTSETTVADNLTVAGDLTVNGTSTIIDSTTVAIGDNMFKYAKDNSANSVDIGWYGKIVASGTKYNVMYYDASTGISTPKWYLGLTTTEPGNTADIETKGTLVANLEGNVTGDVTGDVTGTADTATVATNITVSANNSTNETVYPIFVDGATGTQGAESDTGLTYNPSTGMLTTTGVTATFTGNITGDVTGTADTATVATNVTASANNSSDETVYPTFVDGATGSQGIETDTGLTYNPSTGTMTATTFAGNATTATALATGRTIGMTGDVVWTSPSFDGSGNVTAAATIQAGAVEPSMLSNAAKGYGNEHLDDDTTGIARTYDSGAGTTTYVITMSNFGSMDSRKVMVEVMLQSDFSTVYPCITRATDGTTLTILFNGNITDDTYSVNMRPCG